MRVRRRWVVWRNEANVYVAAVNCVEKGGGRSAVGDDPKLGHATTPAS